MNRANTYMNMSEVRVFNTSGTNIANTSTATQNSNYNATHYHADKAIDGDLSDPYGGNITAYGTNHWLLLTFPNSIVIDYIEIVNRSGYTGTNRTPTSIELLDSSNTVLFTQNFNTWPDRTKYVEIY